MVERVVGPTVYLLTACLLGACIPDMGAQPGDASTADADVLGDGGEAADAESPIDADPALIAEGYTVFTTTEVPPFGSVGCQYCHCPDAGGGCNFSAPRIVGKSRSAIANALKTVEEMAPVDLTEHEIDAVAAYLAYLAAQ